MDISKYKLYKNGKYTYVYNEYGESASALGLFNAMLELLFVVINVIQFCMVFQKSFL